MMEYQSFLSTLNSNIFTTTNGLLISILIIFFWTFLHAILWRDRKSRKQPPGPMGIPFLGYIPFLGKEPHKTLFKLKEKYGGLIGLYMGKKYTISINDYNLLKEIMKHPASLDRAPHLFDNIPNTGLLTENGDTWIEQRRFVIFATKDIGLGIKGWEDHIMDEVFNFIKKIKSNKGKPVDIYNDMTASISSNIMSLLIGRRLKEDDEKDKIQLLVDYSHVVANYTAPLMTNTHFPGLRKFCEVFKIGGFDRVSKIQQEFLNFLREEIQSHKMTSNRIEQQDLITTYLEKLSQLSSESKQHSFSEEMLEGNLNTLFLGGSDSITSSTGWLLRLMAKHKDIQDKVYMELMEAVGKEGRAKYMERQKIPYTFAVMMEGQRFCGIVPFSATRRANEDIHVGDYVIPKGAEISPNLWAMHHDPNYWKHPNEFRPERFLTDNGTKLVKHLPSYVPFMLGRRNCPGESIAWMEILFYFSEIVKNFEISSPPGTDTEFTVVPGFVTRLKSHELCFKERKF